MKCLPLIVAVIFLAAISTMVDSRGIWRNIMFYGPTAVDLYRGKVKFAYQCANNSTHLCPQDIVEEAIECCTRFGHELGSGSLRGFCAFGFIACRATDRVYHAFTSNVHFDNVTDSHIRFPLRRSLT